jgi:hypothetical protein
VQEQKRLEVELSRLRTPSGTISAGKSPLLPTHARTDTKTLALFAPPGWHSQVDPASRLTSYSPPSASGRECFLIFTPSFDFMGTPEELQIHAVRGLSAGMQIVNSTIETGVAGGVHSVTFMQTSSQGIRQWWTVYTATWADRAQMVIYGSHLEHLFRAYGPTVDATVARIFVPSQ